MPSKYLFLCCLLIGLCPGCRQAAPPPEKTPPATVKWEGASLNALEERTELVGTTLPLPDRIARIGTAIEGKVIAILTDAAGKPVAEGQQIEKGTVLVRLDPSILQANLAKTEAGRDVLREEEKQAQYANELASAEVERLRKLKEQDNARPAGQTPLVTPVELLKADYALKDAQSKLKAAQGRLATGKAEEEAIRAQMKLLTLSAPISGRLGRLQVVQGQTLSVGSTVAEVIDVEDQIDVLCFVPPSMVHRLQVGQSVESGPVEKDTTSAEPTADGQIEYIAEQAEPETGNFAVKVRLNNKEAHLRANRVLRINVVTQPGRECLALPESAVNQDEETPTVIIMESKIEKNEKGEDETVFYARRLAAKLGVHDRRLHQIEIVSLEDPDKEAKQKWHGEVKDQQFVVKNGQGLQTGDKVKLEVEED